MEKISIFLILSLILVFSIHSLEEKEKENEDYMVLGFYIKHNESDSSSFDALQHHHRYLTSVSMASFSLNQLGNVERTSIDPSDGLALAKEKKKTTFVLFSNLNVNGDIAHQILRDRIVKGNAIKQVIQVATNDGYRGIHIDFEGLQPQDRQSFNYFIQEIAAAAHQNGLRLMVSVPPKATECTSCEWNGAFDYSFIGKHADIVQVMTYDEHGIWDNQRGSIASYDWIDEVLAYSVTQIPSEKIIMGLPAYAYDWNISDPKQNNGYEGMKYWDTAYQWDPETQSAYYKYTDKNNQKHEVWFEDQKSIENKVKFVKKYKLAGISVWRLGHENIDFWKSIHKGL